jgi:hypothetical protein
VHEESVSARKIELQRISCIKAEIVSYLAAHNADERSNVTARLQSILAEYHPELLFSKCHSIDPRLPPSKLLMLYYYKTLLRRALYRAQFGYSWSIVKVMASIMAGNMNMLFSAFGRGLFSGSVVEIARWIAVNAICRNRTSGHTPL